MSWAFLRTGDLKIDYFPILIWFYMITKQSSCKLFVQFHVLSYLCLWLCTQKFTIHVSRWSQPQQIREGSPSSSYLQVCVRDCMKRAQMTSWLHNCTQLIKMADIMLLSTCIQKTELWLTFQQCCCLWYWEMAPALSRFNSITLKQCRALTVTIGLAGKGMKRFFLFFSILAEYAMTISNVPTWMRIQS